MFFKLTNAATGNRHIVNLAHVISVYEVDHETEPGAPDNAKTGVMFETENSALGFYATESLDDLAETIAFKHSEVQTW